MIIPMEQMKLVWAMYCKTLDKFQTFEADGSQQLTVSSVASYFADDDIWEYKDSLFIV